MSERKLTRNFLWVAYSYAGFCLMTELLILHFIAKSEIGVLVNLCLLIGWLYVPVSQARIQHYENMKQQLKLLRAIDSPSASAIRCSIAQDIFHFKKIFPKTMRLVRFLEKV